MIRIPNPFCPRAALAGLLLWSVGALAEHYTVPLLVPAGTTSEPQGVLRILNTTDESGTVEIYAIDDAGTRSGPASFTLSASAAAEFTATDLASGNATLGLTGGIGTEVGDARLQIETDLDIVPLAFVRAADGTLSAMHDTVRGASSADGSDGYIYEVPIFNPASDVTQVSRLRLINPGDAAAAVTIGGRDDSGAEATGGDVTLTLAAGGAKTLTAQQLEAGDTDLTGQLGAGTGKWRLTVSSDQPLEVVNIVASTAGYWNNLSTTAVTGAAPGSQAGFNERFVGNSTIYETSGARSTLEAADGNRFTDTVEADGVTETYMGSYGYRAIGPDAGLLTLDYDDGDACRANLYFSSRTSGWFASHCTGSDYPAEGSWLAGTWLVEADDGAGDVTETTYEVNDTLPGVPTSGFFAPSIIGDGSLQFTSSGTTIGLNNGTYFELNDGTRYTCASANGCTIVNGTVTAGTVTGRAPGAGEVDRFPSFRTAAAPGNQTYTVGTAIDTLSLPEATGGNGGLTYSLAPSVPGLTFNATARQLSGTPSAAGTHVMTYTVTDEDGDSDTLSFTVTVEEPDGGGNDRAALMALYNATDGANWSRSDNWGTDAPLYTWYGVTVRNDRVFGLSLSGNQLSGPIPVELGNLANLVFLLLHVNQLSGPIPAELGNLANLQRLFLAGNQLSGPIPAELGNLANLAVMYLGENQLSGPIPVQLGNLANLAALSLGFNQLSGPIPTELGNLANLVLLLLHENQLSGPIPVQLGNLVNLQTLILSSNQLSGPIPAELGNLANLQSLLLRGNQLSGCIPGGLRDIPQNDLSQLDLTFCGDDTMDGETSYGVGDEIATLPTGSWTPDMISDGSFSVSGGNAVVRLNNSGYIEVGDYRFRCQSADGCEIRNRQVVSGMIVQSSTTTMPEDTQPSFTTSSGPGNQSYEVGTAIDTLTLPEATGGNGDLTYSLAPSVSGLTFNATTRQLSGTPSTAGTHTMTYTVTDEDGDSDTLSFTITVNADTTQTGALGECYVSLTVGIGQSCTYPGTTDAFSVNARGRGSFLTFLAGIRIRINNQTINGRVYDFEASHQGDGVWRIDRIAGSTEVPDTPPMPGGGTDNAALMALYNATGGANWSRSDNWGTDAPLDQWYGVTVDRNGRVIELGLSENQLSGPIPAGLGNLANLERLDLGRNALTGSIPPDLGNLTNLETLDLAYGDNALSGSIPPELGNLTNLTWLRLAGNTLSGSIPPELGQLGNLQRLDLDHNELSGSVPSWLGNLTNLHALDLASNQLSGGIPPELGNLTNLRSWLFLYDNQLSGPIPAELGNLANLESLALDTNQLSGPIPADLGNLTNLRVLSLFNNQLNGPIPAQLGNLANLVSLWLDRNQLSGPIPAQLGNLVNLQTLILSSNQLSGPIPAQLGNLANLEVLWLQVNQLSGPIPAQLGNLANLRSLFLQGNQLSGCIPDGLRDVSSSDLAELDLTFCGDVTMDGETAYEVGDEIATLPTGSWFPDVTWGGNFSLSEGNAVVRLNNGGYIEVGDYRFRCQSTGGCEISNRQVVSGTIVQSSTTAMPEETQPSFTTSSGPGNQSYEVGTAIDTLTLPEATGGNGDLTYSLAPSVPGLTFNAIARQLTGTPSAAGTYAMTYTVTDEDGDSDTLSFTLTVEEPDGGGNDRAALMALYNATDGANWSRFDNWGTDAPLGQWYGVTVDRNGRVIELNLSDNQLSGPIPAELGNLANLAELSLGFNQLSGPIPAQLGNLANLVELSLHGNELTGAIPPEIGRLTALEHLSLAFNQFTGAIPAELGNLSNLTSLSLRFNRFSGPIPADLTKLTNLQSLNLHLNQLTGVIPAGLGGLPALQELALSRNRLTGPIPAELGKLTALQVLALDRNQLSGPIPAELGNLANLAYLFLGTNQLSGPIPAELGNLANLVHLFLDTNQLSGPIPAELGNLANLEILRLGGNQLSGTVPAELGALTALRRLDLSFNQLTDIALLAQAAAWGEGVQIDIRGNPLNDQAFATYIPALKALGVAVNHDLRLVDQFPDSPLVHLYNDNVVVMQVDGDLTARPSYNSLAGYATEFFAWFEDEFDSLLFVSNLENFRELSNFGYAGIHYSVMNDTDGLGLSKFFDSRFGSAGRLRSVVHFPSNTALRNGPSLHEILHAWANFAIPTAVRAHWGFSSANGQLGGFDIANLVDLGGGRWTAGDFGTIANYGNRLPYSPIELYFAGLLPREEVPDLWVAEDGQWLLDENDARVRTGDGDPIFTADNVRTITVADIISEHGERDPPTAERPHLRSAVILLIDDQHLPSADVLQTVSEHAAWLSFPGDDGENSSNNYHEATGGRGALTLDGLNGLRKSEAAVPANLPASFGIPPTPHATTMEELDGNITPSAHPHF